MAKAITTASSGLAITAALLVLLSPSPSRAGAAGGPGVPVCFSASFPTTSDGVKLIRQPTCDCQGFPIVIKNPGSYRLASNLTLVCDRPEKHVIDIQTDGVTLDLNGFVIEGPCDPDDNSCTSDSNGVNAKGKKHIVVRNGTIKHIADDGINVGAEAKIEEVRLIANLGEGIIAGEGSLIKDNVLHNNYVGIETEDGSSVTGNVLNENRSYGVECDLEPDEDDTPGPADHCFLSQNVFRRNKNADDGSGCVNDVSNFLTNDNSCDGSEL